MNILLVFATNSGGTQACAQSITDAFAANTHTVTQKNPKEVTEEDIKKADAVILASPSWDYQGQEGQPHEDFLPLFTLLKGKTFPQKKFAVFGLGDSTYTFFCGAVDRLEKLVEEVQGTRIIPSLRIDGYYMDEEKARTELTTWTNKLMQTLSPS